MALKKPPQTPLARSRELLGLASGVASREFGTRLKGFFGDDGAKVRNQIENAQALVQTLGRMKGAAMKFGQLLSVELSDLLPPEVASILANLQDRGEAMDFSVVQDVLREDLGAERLAKLHALTPTPIASASIGQVHAARLGSATGAPLAVKVQFPGIRDTIDSDLSLLEKAAKGFLAVSSREADLTPVFDELRSVLKQEADYVLEAQFLNEYRTAALAYDSERYAIPEVYLELSTSRVLTMSLEPGLRLTDFLARKPSLELREHYARAILDLYFSEFFKWGLVQTDPNFANFLFRPTDKKLVLLDFGATRRYPPAFRERYSQLLVAAQDKRRDDVLDIAYELEIIDRRESQETLDLFLALLQKSLEPFRPELQPFDFSASEYRTEVRNVSVTFAKALRFTPPPRAILFLHRKLGGVFHLIRNLDVRMDLLPYWNQVRHSS